MSNKTFLVARREILENIRTKGFWVGVLLVPVILIISITVPRWLSGQKEMRKYAVIDESGWMLAAVEEQAAMPDMEKVLRNALDDRRKGRDEKFEQFPAGVKAIVESFESAQVQSMLEGDAATPQAEREREIERREKEAIAGLAQYISDPTVFASKFPFLREQLKALTAQVAPLREAIKDWWKSLPPQAAAEFAPGATKSRFMRVDVDVGGSDPIESLNKKVAKGELFAYFVIGRDPVVEGDSIRYASSNLTDSDLLDTFMRDANAVVRDKRLDEKDIDKLTAQWVQKPVDVDSRKVGKDGKEEKADAKAKARQLAPMGFAYLLWLAVFSITQMLLTNTIEEKSSRIIEVLLSSISPLQLMMGKIFGIAVTGIMMISAWTLSLIAVFKFLPDVLQLPPFLGQIGDIMTDPKLLGCFVVYFILGYMLYASLLVGIGAACNTLKEAQNLMGPISIVMMIPILAIAFLAQDPNGRLAVIMSFVPPFTPFVMMNRAAADIPLWQFVGTTALLLVSIAIVMYCAAKVFRVGILMSGSAPSLKELFAWIKAPVGQLPEAKQGK